MRRMLAALGFVKGNRFPFSSPVRRPGRERDEMKLSIDARQLQQAVDALLRKREDLAALEQTRDDAAAVINRIESEIAALRGCLAEREHTIAASGGSFPDQALPEETEIERLQRHARVAQAGLRHANERVSACAAEVGRLSVDVDTAWEELGCAMGRSFLNLFHRSAFRLRDLYVEYCALREGFGWNDRWEGKTWWSNLRVLGIADEHGKTILDPFFLSRNENWRGISGELADAIRELRATVDAAKRQ